MIDQLFLTVNTWLQTGSMLAITGSFIWGMISVTISPCHMASIPLLIAYVAGQNTIMPPRQAAWYAVSFTTGLFVTILVVGFSCLLLGRMLGDIGPYWQLFVGMLLIWVAVSMFKTARCSNSSTLLQRINIKGIWGAFLLGLAYGLLSGICTFGFLAPIIGVITIQEKMLTGLLMILLFGVGHCLPLVVAGMFSATLGKIMSTGKWYKTSAILKNIAAAFILGLGIYSIIEAFKNYAPF
jgi:cytochrome c-type biogenesis protein